MFSLKHKQTVEHLSLILCILSVGTEQRKDGLSGILLIIDRMHYHACVIENTALHLISISHDNRQFCNKADSGTHFVFQTLVLALVIVGIESKD